LLSEGRKKEKNRVKLIKCKRRHLEAETKLKKGGID
jgi:hypothetical protein